MWSGTGLGLCVENRHGGRICPIPRGRKKVIDRARSILSDILPQQATSVNLSSQTDLTQHVQDAILVIGVLPGDEAPTIPQSEKQCLS